MNRGGLNLSFNGDNQLVYTHADQLSESSVTTNQSLSRNWAHLVIRADFNSSKLTLFLDGEKKDEVPVSNVQPLKPFIFRWVDSVKQCYLERFFNGRIDDLRFYASSLSDGEIQNIFNDDLTGADLAANGSRK